MRFEPWSDGWREAIPPEAWSSNGPPSWRRVLTALTWWNGSQRTRESPRPRSSPLREAFTARGSAIRSVSALPPVTCCRLTRWTEVGASHSGSASANDTGLQNRRFQVRALGAPSHAAVRDVLLARRGDAAVGDLGCDGVAHSRHEVA